MNFMEDKEILSLFEARSEKAIEAIAAKYGRYCYMIAYTILRNKEDAEECVNDAYLRAWNAIPPFYPENLEAYLAKLTRNRSIDEYRRKRTKKAGSGEIEVVFEELQECIPVKGETPEAVAERYAIHQILEQFLEKESVEERAVFVQRYWYMLSVKEIARMHRMSRSRVTSLLFRQRNRLKKMLWEGGFCDGE